MGKWSKGFARLPLFKSYPHPFYDFFFFFCSGLSQIGSKWPVFVLGFNRSFFSKIRYGAALNKPASLFLPSRRRRRRDSISRIFDHLCHSTIISFASLPADSGGSNYKRRKKGDQHTRSSSLCMSLPASTNQSGIGKVPAQLIKVTTISSFSIELCSPLKSLLLVEVPASYYLIPRLPTNKEKKRKPGACTSSYVFLSHQLPPPNRLNIPA